jgi:hypothetical protein
MILFFEDHQVRCRMSDGGRPPEVSVQTRISNRSGAAVVQKAIGGEQFWEKALDKSVR